MLSLERMLTVDGITVFRDHADPNQFWYLPGPVTLATRPGSNQPALSFLKYKPAVADGGVKGGGFAMLETVLEMTPQRLNRIRAAVSAEPGVTAPTLASVPFETGTVQCIALNVQGSGGTSARPAPAGAFNAVEEILGATTPSLDSENRAAFSLVLSQEGSTILAQAFTDGLAPIGVIYSLTYSAMRPAINVEIKADYERIFQQFSASIEGQYMFFRAGIEAAFEQLKQTGAIEIKVIDFTGEQDEKDKEKWALDFFRDQLLADWFKPTLTPGKIAGEEAQADPLSQVIGLGRDMLGGTPTPTPAAGAAGAAGQPAAGAASRPATGQPAATPAPPGGVLGGIASAATATGAAASAVAGVVQPRPAGPVAAPAAPGAPASPATPHPAGPIAAPVPATPPPTPAAVPSAVPAVPARAVLSPDPANTPAGPGRTVTHVPATTGTLETVTITGAGAQVSVAGAPIVPGPNGAVTIDVPPGPAKSISVTWPAGTRAETFLLYFDFDEPKALNWDPNPPPSAPYRLYVQTNNPADDRFLDSSGIWDGTPAITARPWTPPTERGGTRLNRWLGTLVAPRTVTIAAHASYEQSPQAGSTTPIFSEPDRRNHNMQLSIRRRDVAIGIIGSGGSGVGIAPAPSAFGDTEARGDPNNPATGDMNDRVVKIAGTVADGTPATWRGTISRAATPVTPTPVTPTPVTPTPVTPTPVTPTPVTPTPVTPTPVTPTPVTPTPAAKPITTNIAVSLKLRFVRQEERKVMTFRYNRAEAVKRVYAPQGFVGLMLADIDDAKSFMTEIDLDDPFFRAFEIIAEAPGDFARIGLTTAQAAIDYGSATDRVGIKHHDFLFRPGDQGPAKHSFFLSETRDLEYGLTRQFHFDPASGWDAPQSTYEIPATRTADRTLLLSPADVLDFLEIGVQPGDIDAGIIERIDVTLTIAGPAGFTRSTTIMVLPGSPIQTWRVRAPRGETADDRRRLSYSFVHHLKVGTTRSEGPFETLAGRIIVHDPFPAALEILLLPLFGDTIAEAFAEIEYLDAANNYPRFERVSAKAGATDPIPVRIALLDDKKRDFRIRFTFVGKDLSVNSGAFFTPDRAIVPWKP